VPLQILSGWKEIARHLGRGVRTAQRYERELALPIRRPTGKSHGSVVATADELDTWVTAIPIREQFRLTHSALNTDIMEQLRRNVQLMSQLQKETHRLQRESEQARHALLGSLALLRANFGFAMRDTLPPKSGPSGLGKCADLRSENPPICISLFDDRLAA
jgi:hypothetical protein